jgi:ABC-type multidrug transport system permease subunit
MNSRNELGQLTWTRVLLFLREPEALFWVFLFPIVLALVLSVAFKNQGVDTVQVGAVTGALAERWGAALEEAEAIDFIPYESSETAGRKLRSGAVAALVEGDETLVIRYDPTRPEGETARLRINDAVQQAEGRVDLVPVMTDVVTEHGSRYIDFLIPGLLGMNLMGTGIWGTGFAIVDMRQKKLLKRLLVTPMKRTNFLFAQMLSRFLFLVFEVAVITVFGVWALGVPFRGSFLAFAFVCTLGALCFAGIGLLVASRSQTVEGVSGLMNFVMLPMWLLSGVFFSYENFPAVFHPLIRLLPLTALNDGLRGIMLEGEAATALLVETGVLLVWTVGGFLVSLRVFRWS